MSPGLSEIYNPDLLDPEEKEHLVEVFDSDKDIDIDINHLIRSRNHFDIRMVRKSRWLMVQARNSLISMKGNKIQIQYKDRLEVKIVKSSLLLYVIIDKCKLPSDIMGLY